MPSPKSVPPAASGIAAFLLVLLLLGSAAEVCLAGGAVTVDLGTVYASNKGDEVDPGLMNLRGKLQVMFNYSSYKMIDRRRRTLAVGESGTFELPGRRAMHVSPLPAPGNKVRLSVQIREGGKNLLTTTVGMSRGGMVLVGGPSHEDGVLILILSAS
ncbi:MAG: hypothetical protein AB1346_05860 [Thermodesulfobacteriota bacterium]